MSVSSSTARDLGPPLVDLRVRARRRIDDGRRRPRLGGDADEVVEDRLRGELLDDPRAGAPAREPGRDDRHLEDLQRAGDVDALAAREREHLARAMAEADLEHRDGERPVERRVRRDRDDHVTIPQRLRRGLRSRTTSPSPTSPASATGFGGDEVGRRDEPVAVVDLDPAEAFSLRHGERERRRSDRRARRAASRSAASARCERGATSSTRAGPYPVSASAYTRPWSITCTRRYWSSPYERSSRSASFRAPRVSLPSTVPYTVTPPLSAAAACDQPASRVCPVFPPTSGGQLVEQVVGRRERPCLPGSATRRARQRVADERDSERVAHERRRVARARDVARLVEPVRVLEVRVGEAELLGFGVHELDETIGRSAADVKRERLRGVVRARDEHRAQRARRPSAPPPHGGTTVDSPTLAARGLTRTTSASCACSSTTTAVISFVMLAIARARAGVAAREHRRRRRRRGTTRQPRSCGSAV